MIIKVFYIHDVLKLIGKADFATSKWFFFCNSEFLQLMISDQNVFSSFNKYDTPLLILLLAAFHMLNQQLLNLETLLRQKAMEHYERSRIAT